MATDTNDKTKKVDLPKYVIRILKVIKQKIDAYDLSANKNFMLKIPILTAEPYCYEAMKLIEKTLNALGFKMNYNFSKNTSAKSKDSYKILFSVSNKA